MKQGLLRTCAVPVAVALVATLIAVGAAGAEPAYGDDERGDVYVNLGCPLVLRVLQLFSGTIDAATVLAYYTQEGLHATLHAATGISVDYSYVWVGVCGQWVPIDPPMLHN